MSNTPPAPRDGPAEGAVTDEEGADAEGDAQADCPAGFLECCRAKGFDWQGALPDRRAAAAAAAASGGDRLAIPCPPDVAGPCNNPSCPCASPPSPATAPPGPGIGGAMESPPPSSSPTVSGSRRRTSRSLYRTIRVGAPRCEEPGARMPPGRAVSGARVASPEISLPVRLPTAGPP